MHQRVCERVRERRGKMQNLVKTCLVKRNGEYRGCSKGGQEGCTSSLNRTENIAVQFRSPRFKKKERKKGERATAPVARRIGRPEFFLISLKNSLSFAGAVRY